MQVVTRIAASVEGVCNPKMLRLAYKAGYSAGQCLACRNSQNSVYPNGQVE